MSKTIYNVILRKRKDELSFEVKALKVLEEKEDTNHVWSVDDRYREGGKEFEVRRGKLDHIKTYPHDSAALTNLLFSAWTMEQEKIPALKQEMMAMLVEYLAEAKRQFLHTESLITSFKDSSTYA